MFRSPFATLGLMLAFLSSSTGCTLIGAGIGASTRKWTEVIHPETLGDTVPMHLRRAESLSVNDDVEIRAEQVIDPSLDEARAHPLSQAITGTFLGVKQGNLLVQTEQGRVDVPVEATRGIRRSNETYWLEGTALGFGIDVVLVGVFLLSGGLAAGQK